MPHHAPHAQWCTLILIFSFTINIKYNTIQDNENDLSSFTLVACKQIVPVNLFFFKINLYTLVACFLDVQLDKTRG